MRTSHLFSLAALIVCLLALTACPHKEEDFRCHQSDEPSGDLKTALVRADFAMCGTGYWDNLWFRPADSMKFSKPIWLRPFAVSDEVQQTGFRPEKGQILEITYKNMKPDNRYDGFATCAAYPGDSEDVFVKSIKVVRGKDCNDGKDDNDDSTSNIKTVNAIFKKVNCDAGVWGNLWLEVETEDKPNGKSVKMLLYPFTAENLPKRKPLEGERVQLHYSIVNFIQPDPKVSACRLDRDYLTISVTKIVW
jgi:hypothetical protein